MRKAKLKPCPFCGEEPYVALDTLRTYIACIRNDCLGPLISKSNKEEAVIYWNTRHEGDWLDRRAICKLRYNVLCGLVFIATIAFMAFVIWVGSTHSSQ